KRPRVRPPSDQAPGHRRDQGQRDESRLRPRRTNAPLWCAQSMPTLCLGGAPDSRASACPGKAANGFRSSSSTLCSRPQRDGGLGCEQQERQRLLEVEAYDAVGVAQIADRNVLPDVQVEIAATRGEHEGTG